MIERHVRIITMCMRRIFNPHRVVNGGAQFYQMIRITHRWWLLKNPQVYVKHNRPVDQHARTRAHTLSSKIKPHTSAQKPPFSACQKRKYITQILYSLCDVHTHTNIHKYCDVMRHKNFSSM